MKSLLCTFIILAAGLALLNDAWALPKTIRSTIEQKLDKATDLGAYDVSIYTRDGYVKLSGSVATEAARKRVEAIARETKGVNQVDNLIRVDAGLAGSAVIPNRVTAELRRHPEIINYSLDAKESQGVVTLTGNVARQTDSDAIENVVKSIEGVSSVVNQLRVEPALTDAQLAENVRQELSRSGVANLSGIEIASSNGIVHFRGARKDHRDIDQILSTALMVKGVKDVESDFTINGRPYSTTR